MTWHRTFAARVARMAHDEPERILRDEAMLASLIEDKLGELFRDHVVDWLTLEDRLRETLSDFYRAGPLVDARPVVDAIDELLQDSTGRGSCRP